MFRERGEGIRSNFWTETDQHDQARSSTPTTTSANVVLPSPGPAVVALPAVDVVPQVEPARFVPPRQAAPAYVVPAPLLIPTPNQA